MASRADDLWQLSLVWSGEVVAVARHRGPPGRHPFLALAGGQVTGPAADAPGYRVLDERGALAVRVEAIAPARWPRRGAWSRHEALSLVVTALVVVVLHALTLVRPALSPVVEASERAGEGQVWLEARVRRAEATDCGGEPEPEVAHRAVSPAPSGGLFQARPAPERPMPLLGARGQDTDRGPARAQLAADHAPGLLDVQRSDRPEGPTLREARWHTISPGETLEGIAKKHGLGGYRGLYNERLNPELVRRRPDPHRVFPGDRVRTPG